MTRSPLEHWTRTDFVCARLSSTHSARRDSVMSFDPLSSGSGATASSQSSMGDRQAVRSISPFAPRSPLPGEQRSYRPPGAAVTQSPPRHYNHQRGEAGVSDGWSSHQQHQQHPQQRGADSPPLPPAPPHQYSSPTRNHGNGHAQSSSTSTMQPRSAQVGAGHRRVDVAADDGDDARAAAADQRNFRPPPAQPYVRMRIIGLEKNRKDIYVKFNAEVR